MAAASEQLSRLFEQTYVFQCYQPTYSSGHYAFMFASRTRLGTAKVGLARGHPSTHRRGHPSLHIPSPAAQGGFSLWARGRWPEGTRL